jgi:hypothetical protein
MWGEYSYVSYEAGVKQFAVLSELLGSFLRL